MKVTSLIGSHLFNSMGLEASTNGIHLSGGQMTLGHQTLVLPWSPSPVSSVEPMQPSLNSLSSLPFSLLLQGHLEEFL